MNSPNPLLIKQFFKKACETLAMKHWQWLRRVLTHAPAAHKERKTLTASRLIATSGNLDQSPIQMHCNLQGVNIVLGTGRNFGEQRSKTSSNAPGSRIVRLLTFNSVSFSNHFSIRFSSLASRSSYKFSIVWTFTMAAHKVLSFGAQC